MSTYEVRLPDGTSMDVPLHITPQEALARAQKAYPEAFRSVAQETPKEGFFENLKAGTRRAVSETGLGIGSLIDEQRARQAYAADKAAEDAQGVKTVGLEDVKKAYNERGLLAAMGQLPPAARDLLAQSAPQMAATLAGAKAGAMAGTPLGPAGTVGGALVGGMAAGVPMFFGSNLARQHEAAPAEEFDKTAAATAAAGQSLLDTASNLFVLGKAFGITKLAGVPIPVLAKTTPEVAQAKLVQEAQRSLLAATGRGVAKGVATEMPTEVAQQVLERAQAGLPLLDADAVREYQESAFGGALLGGVLGGAAGPVETMQARGQVRRDEAQRAQAIRSAEIEKERQQKETEEASKKSPEYVRQLADKFKAYAEQRSALIQKEKDLVRPAADSLEAMEKARLREQRKEFEKANEPLVEEVKNRLPEVKAALFSEEDFMSSLGTGRVTTVSTPTRRGETETPIAVGAEGSAQPIAQKDVKERLQNIVLDLKEGMAFTGEAPSADAIAKAFAEDPEVLQYVVTSADPLPGFNKSLSKLIKQHADKYRRGQIRAQQQEEVRQNVLGSDVSGIVRKPEVSTDPIAERLAELATQPTEPTVPRAYTAEKSTIPVEPSTNEPAPFNDPLAVPQAEKEDVVGRRLEGIRQLEARIKELDDIVKTTAATPYGFGEQEFQAAAAQKERDKLIAQLQQAKRDATVAEQKRQADKQKIAEENRRESAVQSALEAAFGPSTTDIDADTQTSESAYREAFGRYAESISDWIGAKNLPDTVTRKSEFVQKNKDEITKAKHALALFAAKRIQLAREANGLEPLTIDSATLHKLIMQRIDRAFRDVVHIDEKPQKEKTKPVSTPASIARDKRAALNEKFLNKVKNYLKRFDIHLTAQGQLESLIEKRNRLEQLQKQIDANAAYKATLTEDVSIIGTYKKRLDAEIARAYAETQEKQTGPRAKPWRLDERRRQATIARQLIEVRRKLRALEDASKLTTERRATGAASSFAPELQVTDRERSRLRAAERNLVEQQNTPFALYRMQRDVQPLIDQLSNKGVKKKKLIDRKGAIAAPTRIQNEFLGRQYLDTEKIEKERQQDEEDARKAAVNAELAKQGFVNRFPGDTEGMTEAQKAEYLSARQPDLLESAYEKDAERKQKRVEEATDAENAASWQIHFKRREIEDALAALQTPSVRRQVDAALARADAAHTANYKARKQLRTFKPSFLGTDVLFSLKEHAKNSVPYERIGYTGLESTYRIVQRLQKAVDDTAAEYAAASRRLEALVGYKLPEAEETDRTTVTTELFRKATAPLRLKQAAKATKEAAIIDAIKAYREIEDVALSRPVDVRPEPTVKYPHSKEYRETIVAGSEAEKKLPLYAKEEARRATFADRLRNLRAELTELTKKSRGEKDSAQVAANKKLQRQLDAYNKSFAEIKARIATAEAALNKARDAAIEAGKNLRELQEKTRNKITPWQPISEPTPLQKAEIEYENAEKAYRKAYDNYENAIKRGDAYVDSRRADYVKAVDEALDISDRVAEIKTEILLIEEMGKELPSSQEYDKLKLDVARAKAMLKTRVDKQRTAADSAQERYEEAKKDSEERQRKLELLYGKPTKIDKQSPYELTAPFAPAREREAVKTSKGTYGTAFYEEKVDEGTAVAREAKLAKRAESGKRIKELTQKISQKQYRKFYAEGRKLAVDSGVAEAEQNAYAHKYAANKIAGLASQEFEKEVERGEKQTQIRPQRNRGRQKIERQEETILGSEVEAADVGESGIDFGGGRELETAKRTDVTGPEAPHGYEYTDHPLHGKSLAEAAQYGYERARSPIRKALFKAVAEALKDSKGKVSAVRIGQGRHKNAAATYNDTTDNIRFNYLNQDRAARPVDLEVLLHELTHAATVRGLKLDPELNEEVTKIRKIVQDYLHTKEGKAYVRGNFGLSRRNVFESDLSLNTLYSMTSNEEFLAEAFADTQFQKMLMQIPAQNKRPNLWSRFVHAVAKFFGATNPKEIGILADVMSLAERAMDTTAEGAGSDVDVGSVFESPKSIHDNPETEEAYNTMVGGKGVWDTFKENFLGLGFRARFIDTDAASVAAFRKGDPVAAIQAEYNLMKYRNKNHLVAQSVTEGPLVRTKSKIRGQDAFVIEAKEGGPTLTNVSRLLADVKGFGNTQATNEAFSLYEIGNRAKDWGWGRIFADLPVPQNATTAQKLEIEKENALRETARKRAEFLANDPDTIAKFKQAHDEYQAWNKGMLRFVMQAGVITEEEYRRLSANANYTPAFRADHNNNLQLELDAGKTITVGKIQDEATLQQLRGGSGKLMNFFHASVLNASVLVDAALHNIASRDAALTLQAAGLAHPVNDTEKGPDIIEFRADGKEDRQRFRIETEAVGIPTHLVAKGFEGVPSSMPGIIRVLGMPAQLLRRAVTRNPLYMARQLVRDPLSAWMVTGADMNPVLGTIKEVSKAISGMSDKTLDRRGVTGGMIFAENETDLDRLADEAQSVAKPWHAGWWFAKLDHAALGADATTRRQVYDGAIKEGLSEMEAELAAWKSMPFSKRGSSPSVRMANHLIPFLSASIQGWDTMYRAIKGDMPLHERVNVRNKLLQRGALIAGLSLLYAAGMEDDEGYQNLSDQVRLKNWVFRAPGTDTLIKIPVPFEHGVFWKMIPEAAYRAMVSDKDSGDEAKAVFKALLGMLPGALPQAGVPIIEATLNRSFFTDAPIEGRTLQGLEVGERWDDKTSEMSKWLGQVSAIAGVSPKKLEYMLNAYTAGIYPAMAALIDNMIPAYSETSKPTKTLAQLPVFKSALADADSTGEVSRLYDKIESMTEFSRTMKHLAETQPERAQEYFEENSKKIAAGSAAEKMKANLDKFAAIENKIRSVPASAMTPDQKKDALDRVRAAKIAAARQMNASLRSLAA